MSQSFSQEAVRKFYPDPLLQRINDISKRLAKVETQTEKIETDDVVGVGDSDHSKVRFNDKWRFLKKWTIPDDPPLITFEPDYNVFKLDLRFDSMGDWVYDKSLFNNNAEIFGEPCPASGANIGFRGGSMKNTAHNVTQADPTYYVVYTEDPNDEPIDHFDMTGLTTGHSWIFRINLKSISTSNGRSQTFIEHYDDSSNRYSVRIGNDANIKYIVSRAGTDYKQRTNNAPISINTDLEIAVTYNVTGNVIKFYINGTEDTSVTTSTEGFEAFNFNDLYLLSHVPISTQTPVKGFCDLNYIDMMRFYKRVLTPTEILNHYTNKISISNIPVNRAAITDASVMAPGEPSFTTTSFTTTSFTAE